MDISLYSPEECERIAAEASLRYVKANQPGITRKLRGKTFIYLDPRGNEISDPKVLERIKTLAIPPAYEKVWICPFKNGHIQATGFDSRNRKQYRYHPYWRESRQQQKFNLMREFGESLPLIRKHIAKELNKPLVLDKKQLICALIYLLDTYGIRVGNPIYAKENKSYGLTTLRKKHLAFQSNKAVLTFNGKNAKPWELILKDKKIIKLLKKCDSLPGYELFKYYDTENQLNVINSQDINAYLKALTNHPFTAKDFRTWAACRETLCRLKTRELLTKVEDDKSLKEVIGEVSNFLGHTPAICLKNYIYPEIILCWKQKRLHSWIKRSKKEEVDNDLLLLAWLKYNHKFSLKLQAE